MSLEYEKAIDCYTRCFPHIPDSDHLLKTVVLSNRAQCQIKLKKYELAFQDADAAIKVDPNHLKSIQRRGTSAYYTQRLRQARKDFMHSLSIEYSKQFVEYLEIVNKKIQNIKLEAQEKLKRKALFNSGISFFGEEDDQAQHHPDELKKRGMEKFKQRGLKIEI